MYVQVVFSNYKMYVQVVFSPDEIKRRLAEFNQDKSSQGIILTNKETGANYSNKALENALTTLYSLNKSFFPLNVFYAQFGFIQLSGPI